MKTTLDSPTPLPLRLLPQVSIKKVYAAADVEFNKEEVVINTADPRPVNSQGRLQLLLLLLLLSVAGPVPLAKCNRQPGVAVLLKCTFFARCWYRLPLSNDILMLLLPPPPPPPPLLLPG